MTGNSNSSKLLIFDFDNTITNLHMHNYFSRICPRSDYVSNETDAATKNETNAATEEDIEKFLQKKDSGIKNAEKLKSVLQKALEQGVEVAIASFTSYPKAVEYVVEKHLCSTTQQAKSIKVVGGLPDRKISIEHGKNLHILYLLKAYKKKHGKLPQEVMLVDDDGKNVNCINNFYKNMCVFLTQEVYTTCTLKNIDRDIADDIEITAKDLKQIRFKGVQVPREPITEANKEADDGYLGKVEKWVGQKRKKQVGFCENDNYVHVFERNRDAFIEHFRSLPPREALKELQESLSNLMTPPKDSTKDDIRRRQGLNKREIQLREDLIKEMQDRIEQQNKPPLWQKVGIMIAPPVVGAAIGSLVLIAGTGLPLIMIAVALAVIITVAVYAIEERYLKPKLKPSDILSDCREAMKQMIHKPTEQGKV